MVAEDNTVSDARKIIAEKLKRLFPHGCQRVLLVTPPNVPEEDFSISVALDKRYPVFPPDGLAFLAKFLLARGYERRILDLNFMMIKNLFTDPSNFSYDIWKELLKQYLEEFKPDVVCLTCMFTIYYRQMKRLAGFVKKYNSNLPVFAGGVHTSDAADLVAEDCADIDFIGLYEGNASLPDVLDFVNGKAGEEKITQLATMIDGKYVAITDRAVKSGATMDEIPDYDDIPLGEYSKYGRIGTYHNWILGEEIPAGTILSNVGCRAQCTFCSVRLFNGRGVFTRDVKTVVDQLELLMYKYGIFAFMFLDDDLFYNARRFIDLCNEIVRRGLKIYWDATNGIIASAMTEEIAAACAASGCIGLSIGIESGSKKILHDVKKPSRVKDFYRCAEILNKYPHIFTKGLLMCGFSNETIGEVLKTVELGVKIRLGWFTTQPLNLIPGVPLTNEALIAGTITKKELVDGTERPYIGSTGGHERRVKQEKVKALAFDDPLDWDPEIIPRREDIKDVWFSLDFRTNFIRLLAETNLIKLDLLRKWFINIFDHTHKESALGHLFFGILEYRLGNHSEAKRRWKLARSYVDDNSEKSSDFWRKRFAAFALYDLLLVCEECGYNKDMPLTIPRSFYDKFHREMKWMELPDPYIIKPLK